MRYLVGVGNYTAGDDAVGLRVVEHVVANGLDRDFVAVDLSTDALSLVAYLNADTEAVLVVDAARLGLAPGDYPLLLTGRGGDAEGTERLDDSRGRCAQGAGDGA